MYALIARLLLRAAGKQIASNFTKQSVQAATKRLAHASFTITKRIGARNARRFIFQDMMSGGISWDLANDLRTRGEETYDTTRWIMGRIIMGAAFKGIGRFAMKQGGIRKMMTRSVPFRTMQAQRAAVRSKRATSLGLLQREHQAIRSGINTRTGEIGGALSLSDRMYNASVWTRLALRKPQTKPQQFTKGLATGFGRQFAGTIIFRELIDKERLAPAAWATQTVHDLDEVWIPPTDANTPYTKSEMLVQTFNAGTVFQSNYGLRRVNRADMLRASARRNPMSYMHSLFGQQGYGQVVGALAAREAQQILGEEQKVQSAYASRYYKRQESDSARQQQTGQPRVGPKRTWVTQYTKSDGTVVKGHWRTVG